MKILKILDIINTAIVRLMTILVPGLIQIFFFIFILFGIFVKNKNEKSWNQKNFSSEILNILDIVNTAIEKLMTILVPGWSRADYLLEYSINSNILLIFILFGIFVDNKLKKKWNQKGFPCEIF